ncbi:MAG: hypothetical protein WBF89_22015 [Steroidobacteraceae bacterium]
MNALVNGMERAAPSQFQIVIRLQAVRARVHEGLRSGAGDEAAGTEATEILAGILGVAIAARAEELRGFTAICMLVYERIERFGHGGRLPRALLEAIAEWSANSELYLRRPRFAEFARSIVRQLNDAPWGSRLDRAEQDGLLRALLEFSC